MLKWVSVYLLFLSSASAAVTFEWAVLKNEQPRELPTRPAYSGIKLASIWYDNIQAYRIDLRDETGKVFFSNVHTHTEYGFRTTVAPASKKPKTRHLFMSGCSFTYGDMVPDDKTTPSQLAQALPEWSVHNLGRSGTSPFDSYYLWSQFDLRALKVPEEGMLIYTLIDDQFERIVPTWKTLSWSRNALLFPDEGAGFGRPYSLAEITAKKWTLWLAKQGLLAPWLRLTSWIDDYVLGSDANYRKMLKILREMKRSYLEQFPKGRFVVTFFFRGMYAPKMVKLLEEEGIEYWEPIDRYLTPDESVPRDPHPSAQAHRLQAELLLKHITAKK